MPEDKSTGQKRDSRKDYRTLASSDVYAGKTRWTSADGAISDEGSGTSYIIANTEKSTTATEGREALVNISTQIADNNKENVPVAVAIKTRPLGHIPHGKEKEKDYAFASCD